MYIVKTIPVAGLTKRLAGRIATLPAARISFAFSGTRALPVMEENLSGFYAAGINPIISDKKIISGVNQSSVRKPVPMLQGQPQRMAIALYL